MKRRVFVVGGYIPNGGTYMSYHLARILWQYFDFQGVVVTVGDETSDNEIFDYDPIFTSINMSELSRSIRDDDVLIANPSFSQFCLGITCRGRKVMYIQGFTTFDLLDCRFDHYVAVSEFVGRFISNTYGIDTTVVPPFIQPDNSVSQPWKDRPPMSVLVSNKGQPDRQKVLMEKLRQLLPEHPLNEIIIGKIPQRQLMARLGQYRYFLSLSPAEGFGLIPLEAMAMGTTVIGFDAYGGRDYMLPGINCASTSYPDIEGIAKRLIALLNKPEQAELLAEAGRKMARGYLYTQERFYADWRRQFSLVLGIS